MKICPNCKTQTEETYCSFCGSATEELILQKEASATPKPKLRKGTAIFRIGFSVLFGIIGIAIFGFGLFESGALTKGLAGAGAAWFFAPWFWGLTKWSGFAIPKTARFARKIARHIIPLTFASCAIELIIMIGITFIPYSLYASTFSVVYPLINIMTGKSDSFILALAGALICGALLVLVVVLDYFQIKGCHWKSTINRIFKRNENK